MAELNFPGHRTLTRVAFYNAPGDRPISPYRIPENTELVELITGGKVYFEQNGEDKLYGKGAIFWHRAGHFTVCRALPESPYRCMVFYFSVEGGVRPMPRISFWEDTASLERFSVDSLSLYLDENTDRAILSDYVIGVLSRYIFLHGRDKGTRSGSYSAPLRRLLDIIGANLQRRMPIEELSRLCQISRPYIFRLFRDEMGMTPHQYITSLQLDRAQLMLAGSARSIKEVAFACGFESLEVFYRRFRAGVGQTPGEYRKARRPYHFTDN